MNNKCTDCNNTLSSESKFCDKCGKKVQIVDDTSFLQLGQVISSFESAVIRIILTSIKELEFPFGINTTIQILRGSSASKIMKHNLHTLNTYGILPFIRTKVLRHVINSMIREKLLFIDQLKELDYQGNPLEVIKISQKGIEFLDSDINKSFYFITELSEKTLTQISGSDLELFQALFTLRNSLVEKDMPTYTVCTNAPLAEMTLKKPDTLEELFLIKGIGQKFIDSYGPKFIALINTWKGK